MNIIGLDLSMTATGICLPDGTTRTLATRASDGDARLDAIAASVRYDTDLYRVELAVIEEAPPGLKGPAIKAIHMVHGAVRTELIRAGVPYVEVNPSTLKLFATGDKSADKPRMAVAAFKRAGVEFPDDNQCDAWWLRQAGLRAYGLPGVELPKAQLAALKAVAWPTTLALAVAS